jgi:hypothetical protein
MHLHISASLSLSLSPANIVSRLRDVLHQVDIIFFTLVDVAGIPRLFYFFSFLSEVDNEEEEEEEEEQDDVEERYLILILFFLSACLVVSVTTYSWPLGRKDTADQYTPLFYLSMNTDPTRHQAPTSISIGSQDIHDTHIYWRTKNNVITGRKG